MSENNDKKDNSYYLPIFIALGLGIGVAFNQIPIGLCLGVAIGIVLDDEKKKID